jgi:archaellum component FlaC
MNPRKAYWWIKCVEGVCIIGVTVAVGIGVVRSLPMEKRLDLASAQLFDCTVTVDGKVKGNPSCLPSTILAVAGSTKASMGAVAQAAPEVSKALVAASKSSVDASNNTVLAAKAATDLLTTAKTAINDLDTTIKDLDKVVKDVGKDADEMVKSSNDTVKKAGLALEELTALENTLDQQIKEQSPEITKTLQAMQALISSKQITDILSNLDDTSASVKMGTEHAAETVKTIDLATRDLRKKAGQVKWLLQQLIEAAKAAAPIIGGIIK